MTTSQAYSRPARLLQIASWVIAVAFAVFLNMLGSLVIRDLMYAPRGGPPSIEQFADSKTNERLKDTRYELEREHSALADKAETIRIARVRAAQNYSDAKESFRNWVATRTATGDYRQDSSIVARTKKLDELQSAVADWQRQQDALNDQQRALQVRLAAVDQQLVASQEIAEKRFEQASRRYALTVFAWRLAFTLPILLVAVWLFLRFRRARYWPFVYGFGLFALSAFFIELVPYLPNFGGYVRVLVGIALTAFAGIYVLRAFQRYVQRKREEMEQSQAERARSVAYDKALGAFQKKLCPSCDKSWSLGGDSASFCIHCGLKLFEVCECGGRNFAFFPFCSCCGKTVRRAGDANAGPPASLGDATGSAGP